MDMNIHAYRYSIIVYLAEKTAISSCYEQQLVKNSHLHVLQRDVNTNFPITQNLPPHMDLVIQSVHVYQHHLLNKIDTTSGVSIPCSKD